MALFTPQSPGGASYDQSPAAPVPFGTNTSRPRRTRRIAASALALLALGGAGFALVRASTGVSASATSDYTVVVTPPPSPMFSDGEVKAATERACKAWDTTSLAIADAGRVSTAAPPDWNNPITRAADAATSRVTLTQVAYLRTQVTAATPADLQHNLTTWQDLSVAIEHSIVQQQASVNKQLVAQQASLNRTLESQCGLQ